MNSSFVNSLPMHYAYRGACETPSSHGTRAATSPSVARRLIAAPWRHALLVAMLTLVGASGSAIVGRRPAPTPVDAAAPHRIVRQDAPAAGSREALELQLDLDPAGARPAARDAAGVPQPAPSASAMGTTRDAAPATPRAPGFARRPAVVRWVSAFQLSPGALLPGVLGGLLLGLVAACARELFAAPLRSSREAELALGVTVLGAIPTLSSRARNALLDPPSSARNAA